MEAEGLLPDSYPRDFVYPTGYAVALKAIPAPGYQFIEWTGSVTGDSETISVSMSCNKSVTAVFAPKAYALTLHTDPDASGEVVPDPLPGSGQAYTAGTEIILSAVAAEGYRFSHWSGDITGEQNPATLTVDSPVDVSANFAPVSAFAWWWIAPAVGVVVIALPLYFLVIRKPGASQE